MLPAAESEAQPLTGKGWDAMVKAAGKLADRELALVNQLLRVTGMRSAEARELAGAGGQGMGDRDSGPEGETRGAGRGEEGREDFGARLFPEGVKNRKVPVPANLVAVLRDREGRLIGPGLTNTDRSDLVNRTHNAWLKGMIGGLGEKVQGNHRLRDTVCSALRSLYGPATAQEVAGHVDPKTTGKHYAKRHGHGAGRDGEGVGRVGSRQCGQPAGGELGYSAGRMEILDGGRGERPGSEMHGCKPRRHFAHFVRCGDVVKTGFI